MTRKTIAVTGATGAQGRGLVHAALESADFSVRAITRDVDSPKARELAELGATVVAADYTAATGLAEAFDGVDAAFLVTDFWSHGSASREQQGIRNLADAVAKAGVPHVCFSTLEDTREHISAENPRMPKLQGSFYVPHLDAKAEMDDYFRSAGVPTTFLRTCFYYENLADSLGPVRDAEGNMVLTLAMGDSPLAMIASADIGKAALAIFRAGEEFIGRTVSIAGTILTGREIADAIGEAIAEPVTYQPMDHDAFRALGFPGADEFGNMLQFFTEFAPQFTGARDVAATRRLVPGLLSLRDWLAAAKPFPTGTPSS